MPPFSYTIFPYVYQSNSGLQCIALIYGTYFFSIIKLNLCSSIMLLILFSQASFSEFSWLFLFIFCLPHPSQMIKCFKIYFYYCVLKTCILCSLYSMYSDSVLCCVNIYGSYILIVECVFYQNTFSLNSIFSDINIMTSDFFFHGIYYVLQLSNDVLVFKLFSQLCSLPFHLILLIPLFYHFSLMSCFNDSVCSLIFFFSGECFLQAWIHYLYFVLSLFLSLAFCHSLFLQYFCSVVILHIFIVFMFKDKYFSNSIYSVMNSYSLLTLYLFKFDKQALCVPVTFCCPKGSHCLWIPAFLSVLKKIQTF